MVIAPTGIESKIPGLPSLDEMLNGGIRGNWVVAGVTSIGKTTVAMHFLGNEKGTNQGRGGTILDYGWTQGQERYLSKYGLAIAAFEELLKQDADILWNDTEILEQHELHNPHPFVKLPQTISWGKQKKKELDQLETAVLARPTARRILKVDMKPRAENELVACPHRYFGNLHGEKEPHFQEVLTAAIYHQVKINKAERWVLDGISLDQDESEETEREAQNLGKYKATELAWVYEYLSAEKPIMLPFIGTNHVEFYGATERAYWNLEHPLPSLTSITLSTPRGTTRDVSDFDDAISTTQSLSLSQYLEGLIVLGRNRKGKYAFADSPTTRAPQQTRILAITKSRFSADETYREFCLDAEGKPTLGREIVLL